MTFRILSIDGGGIRGIIPGEILVSLEEKIQLKTGDRQARLGDYFDLVAGTSTGAILGAAYLCPGSEKTPRFSARDAVNFYLEDGDEIFDVSFWQAITSAGGLNDEVYSADELEKVLHRAFGEIKLSELLKPTCFISYDVRERKPVIFTQHNAIKNQRDFLVRDLLRASTAAPTYFEPAKIHSLPPAIKKHVLVDGGIIANDPTLCAYSEALKFDHVTGIEDMLILSIGTGKELHSYSHSEVKDLGPLGWAKPAIDLALEGGPQMTSYHMQKIASTVPGSRFYRIDPALYGADTTLDNASPKNLIALQQAGQKNAAEYDQTLDQIASELINHSSR